MDIQAEKLKFIQWFSGVTEASIVREFISIKNEKEIDWWDRISKEEKDEIEESLKQAEKGEVKSHNQVMDKYKKWL